ncbi:MAG: glutathione S-transferase N-terminal domain-containing protein [Kofleriaceae bacterium]
MTSSLSEFPIAKRWPPTHPDRLQLYSLPTPNGVKASIMLEETGLPYEVHRIDFENKDQQSDAYKSLNPNGKIPALIDPDGPGGRPLPLFESGAILHYLADKTGMLLPNDPADRWHVMQWVFFQVGHIGPMFGQLGFYVKFEGQDWDEPRSRKRSIDETKRLLGVMDDHLTTREWFVANEFTIADISMLGMVRNLIHFYGAGELVQFGRFANVARWLERGLARPAVQRGLAIPGK